jgi:thiol-disulfide isomerase/thioredoxin
MTPFVEPLRRAGLALLLSAIALGTATAADVGQPAPDLDLQGAGGVQHLSDLKGKVVYVDFWASWCGPCRQSFPWMNEMQAKYAAKGLQVLAVNLDAKQADGQQFLAQIPAHFAVAFDPKGEAPRRFGVKGMPTSVLVGADGRVLAVHQGFREDERAELEQRLASALAAR